MVNASGDLIVVILVSIIAWTIVSGETSGFEKYFLYCLIIASDIGYVYTRFK